LAQTLSLKKNNIKNNSILSIMTQYIDKIFYINLERRVDRREEIEHELMMKDLLKFERFPAIETPGFGALGCAQSHLDVLKLAKERGYKNVLILEDDFMFLVDNPVVEDNLKKLFETPGANSFDVCMLSYNLIDGRECEYPFLLKTYDAQTASGYLVNAPFFDTLINLYQESSFMLEKTGMHWFYANDQAWKILQPQTNWYCFKTRIGKQRPGFSDNANTFTDYNEI